MLRNVVKWTVLISILGLLSAGCGGDDSGDQEDPNNQVSNNDDDDPTNNGEDPTNNGEDPEVEVGTLELTIGGLDAVEGLSPDPMIVVSGDEEEEEVTSSGSTSLELPVGNYEVDAQDVEEGPALFEGSSETVTIEEDETSSVTIEYQVVYGELTVGYDDHPESSNFEATVEGQDFLETISEETTWDDVLPGTYTIDFSSYSTGDIIWDATLDEEEVVVESGSSQEVMTDYEMREGTAEINMSIPDEVSVDFEIVDDEGDVVHSFSNTGSGLESAALLPGDYEVVLAGSVTDEWDNPFSFNGTEESFPIASAETHTQNVSTQLPSQVNVSDDDGDDYGSLREVVNRVNEGTEIHFEEGVSTIELDSTIHISQPVHLMGPSDGHIGITQSSDNSEERLFTVDYEGTGDEVIHFEGIEFFDVEADRGAAVRVTSIEDATVQFFDCIFRDTESTGANGAVEISGSGGSAYIVGSEFTNNITSQNGGAIYYSLASDTEGDLTVQDSVFEGNEAGVRGGAIRAWHGDITIEDSEFEANSAGNDGGAVALGEDTSTEILDTEFLNNSSMGDGGAIKSRGDFWATSIVVEENDAGGDGGGLMLEQSVGSIENSVIYDNSADDKGGGIRLDRVGGGMQEPYEIRSVLLESNEADYGGGIYSGGSARTWVNIVNTTLANHRTRGTGSAAVEWSDTASGTIQFSTILNHTDCEIGNPFCLTGNGARVISRADSTVLNLRGSVIDTSYLSTMSGLVIEDGGFDVISDGYNIIANVTGDGEFTEDVGDVLDASISYSWSESYDDSNGVESLNRVAQLDPGSVGLRDIPADLCEEITGWLISLAADRNLASGDQRGMARPSGAYCSSGAWEPDSRFEDFTDVDLGDSADSGSFTGNDGRDWDYSGAYSAFDDDRIILDQEGSTMSSTEIESLVSGANSIDSMAIIYEVEGPSSDGDRQVRVKADGTVLGTSDTFTSGEGVLVIDDFQDFEDGDGFELEIENNAPGADGAVAIKQVVWR